jgi:hypothetical protein
LLPKLRQRWSWLVYDVYWLPNGCCNVGSKYLGNTIPVSEQKIHRIIEHLIIEQKHWIEQKKTDKQKSNNKFTLNSIGTDWLSVSQNLQGLNIFVITELKIAILFCLCVSSWGISSHAAEFYFLPAGSLVALWRIIELPSTLCGPMANPRSSTSWIP